MNTAVLTKVTGLFLVLLAAYYIFMFFRYRRNYKSSKTAVKRTLFLILPLILCFIIVELVCGTLVAHKAMKRQAHFLTRYSATAYFIKSLKNGDYKTRSIRLREQRPSYRTDVNLTLSDSSQSFSTVLRTDSDGFILPECCGGDAAIVFLGGSTTECVVVDENKRFPFLVANALKSKGYSYTVKNAGRSGNNTFHSLDILLNKVMGYKVAIAVQMEAINDMSILTNETSYHNDNPFRGLIIDENMMEPEAHNEDEFYTKRGYAKSIDTSRLLHEYRKALRLFVGMCRAADIQPVLMTQFNRFDNSAANRTTVKWILDLYKKEFPTLNPMLLYRQMNDAVRQIATDERIPLIDLDLLVPKTATYMYDVVHLNNEGSVFVANIISEKLVVIIAGK